MISISSFEINARRTIVERNGEINALRPLDQRQQLGLAPDRHAAGNSCKRGHKTQKLDRVTKAMIAADKHMPVGELLAAPDPLQVTRPRYAWEQAEASPGRDR